MHGPRLTAYKEHEAPLRESPPPRNRDATGAFRSAFLLVVRVVAALSNVLHVLHRLLLQLPRTSPILDVFDRNLRVPQLEQRLVALALCLHRLAQLLHGLTEDAHRRAVGTIDPGPGARGGRRQRSLRCNGIDLREPEDDMPLLHEQLNRFEVRAACNLILDAAVKLEERRVEIARVLAPINGKVRLGGLPHLFNWRGTLQVLVESAHREVTLKCFQRPHPHLVAVVPERLLQHREQSFATEILHAVRLLLVVELSQ
mmetsp:Transcript_9042/g.22533  ORF Transcript_9042/g.22533 Transcript_9042/m.22533 type:complete len:257 (-) Transcript_9042:1776-2546(-)